jgi:hypothetical protein
MRKFRLKQTLHHWFIPHRKNKFHPVALRPLGMALFLVVYLSLPLAYNITSAQEFRVLGYATNVNINDLHSLSNTQRRNNGLSNYSLNSQLNSAALAKANHMIANNYWAHVAPDGTTPWYFITNAGYDYQSAGENLAKGFSTSSGVVNGWMNSPSHRANVLSGTYRDVGYAAVNGVLQGSETTLVVAMYGLRYSAPAPAPAPVPQPAAPAPVPPEPAPAPRPATPAPAPAPVPGPATSEPADEPDSEEAEEAAAPVDTTGPPEQPQQEDTGAVVATTAQRGGLFGAVAGFATYAPVQAYASSFNWAQRASILLLCTLILLFIMKHTLIWREQKRGYRHIWLRAHPLGQASMLIFVLILTIFSSVGVVL